MNENTDNNEQDNQEEIATTPSAVTIDLDTLDSTDPLDKEELIFRDECERMVDTILKKSASNIKQIKAKDNSDCVKDDEGSHRTPNCFFIDGPRGAGKSTLLRAIRHILLDEKRATDHEKHITLYSLADIDPTELGRGENFFIYLLGKIYATLEREFATCYDDNTTKSIQEALQSIRDMSIGLQILMDSNGVLKNDDAPEFFLENCLEKCANSSMMRKKLSMLIDTLAKIVRKDVFLVTIDDADINFSKCEDVLEYIRKYMHSPRLIFIFAGDIQLYSQVIRGMHLQNFPKKQLKHDKLQEENRNMLLNRMEEQYLLKLFPTDYRIRIPSVKTIINDNRRILVRLTKHDNEKGVEALGVKETLAMLVKIKSKKATIDTILTLPLRSFLFLLRQLAKNPHNDTREAAEYTWKCIQEIFRKTLSDYNVSYEQIGGNNIRSLQKAILEYHARAGLWYADLSMQANNVETQARQVALYLAEAVSQSTMSLSSKIKYWCACFPLWQRVRDEYIYSSLEREANGFLESCLQLTNNRLGSSWANLACAASAPNLDEPHLYGQGVICILNNDCEQDNEIGQDERKGFSSLAESIFNNNQFANDEEKLATAAINKCLCRIDSADNSHYYISIYHLLMNIAEWLDYGYEKFTDLSGVALPKLSQHNIAKIKNEIFNRITKESVANSTVSISSAYGRGRYYSIARNSKRSENKVRNDTEHPIQRKPHTYKSYPSADVVDKMYNWLKEYASLSYASSSAEYTHAWETFQGTCSKYSTDSTLNNTEIGPLPSASSILISYIEAVEQAASSLPPETGISLEKCITSFPFWNALKSALINSLSFKTKLDKANIGISINTTLREQYNQYMLKHKELASKVKLIENDKADAESKFLSAKNELVESEKNMVKMESAYKLIRKTIDETIDIQRNVDSYRESLLDEELHLEQDIIDYKRKETRIERQLLRNQHEIERMEKIMSGKSDDFPEYKMMIEYIQQHVKLMYKTRILSSKQEHQSAIKALKQEIEKLQSEEAKKLPNDSYQQALENRNNFLRALDNVRKDISAKTIKNKEIEHIRKLKDQEFSDLTERIGELKQQDFKARSDFETAKLRYGFAKKYLAETQEVVDKAKVALQRGIELCKQAEEECKSFKTYKPED